MQEMDALAGKSLPELREIAKVLGIDGSKMKKRELIAAISGGEIGRAHGLNSSHR